MDNVLCGYQFANGELDGTIPNRSLILVTGCDMASSWGIAVFSDVSSDMELNFKPCHQGTYSWETNVSVTIRTSPGYKLMSALNWDNSGALSVMDQPATRGVDDIAMASVSASCRLDASHSTFNEVGGNQIYNIMTNIALDTIGKRCKLRVHTFMDAFI